MRRKTNDPRPIPPLTNGDIERFIKKIDTTPGQGPNGKCHTWKGTISKDFGRALFAVDQVPFLASRIAYFLFHSKDPAPLFVLHRCDNGACVNAEDCLFLGTQADNMADRNAKGRQPKGDTRHHVPRGETASRAILTEREVFAIRARRAAGELGKDLAREYGVVDTCISNIVHRWTWRHI